MLGTSDTTLTISLDVATLVHLLNSANLHSEDASVIVTLNDEGVVVDVNDSEGDTCEGTWKTYSEMGLETPVVLPDL